MDGSPPGSSVHGIFQARILEWKKKKEYWNGLPLPSPGDFPDPGIKSESPEFLVFLFFSLLHFCLAFLALASRFFTTVPPGKQVLLENLAKGKSLTAYFLNGGTIATS